MGSVVDQMSQDVCARAQMALADSPVFALRLLRVEGSGQTLHLHGRVNSFYHKQLAQEVVRSVASGVELINTIDVGYSTSDD